VSRCLVTMNIVGPNDSQLTVDVCRLFERSSSRTISVHFPSVSDFPRRVVEDVDDSDLDLDKINVRFTTAVGVLLPKTSTSPTKSYVRLRSLLCYLFEAGLGPRLVPRVHVGLKLDTDHERPTQLNSFRLPCWH